jgi:tRNA-uridine 2-sulfurtransferase
LKFATLLDRSLAYGAEVVATGHYARMGIDPDSGRHVLRRGLDAAKDQSYFLFSLTQDQLSRATFPIGGLTKDAVRDIARRLGLPVAEKPDSQEICFVPDGDYAAFIEEKTGRRERAGTIVTRSGQLLGRHNGVHRFTVGQRKGLGIAAAEPMYVLELRPADQTIVVGPRPDLERADLMASGVNWIAGTPPSGSLRVAAQIRHRHQPAPATVNAVEDGRASVQFDSAVMAVTPGQAVVFYDGEVVLGGGWID